MKFDFHSCRSTFSLSVSLTLSFLFATTSFFKFQLIVDDVWLILSEHFRHGFVVVVIVENVMMCYSPAIMPLLIKIEMWTSFSARYKRTRTYARLCCLCCCRIFFFFLFLFWTIVQMRQDLSASKHTFIDVNPILMRNDPRLVDGKEAVIRKTYYSKTDYSVKFMFRKKRKLLNEIPREKKNYV